jgi:Uma2 family endonuclease
MGETDTHRLVIGEVIQALAHYFAGQEVYVSGNLLLFYEEGNKRRHLSPDVLVTKGLEPRRRKNYLIWQEGLAPQFVCEITSASTRREDLREKFTLYRDVLRVREYFLFDPLDEYLKPRLQGYRLSDGAYAPIAFEGARLPSVELGLSLEADGSRLRLWNPATGTWLLTDAERAEAAEKAKIQVEAELAALREEIARLRDQ